MSRLDSFNVGSAIVFVGFAYLSAVYGFNWLYLIPFALATFSWVYLSSDEQAEHDRMAQQLNDAKVAYYEARAQYYRSKSR